MLGDRVIGWDVSRVERKLGSFPKRSWRSSSVFVAKVGLQCEGCFLKVNGVLNLESSNEDSAVLQDLVVHPGSIDFKPLANEFETVVPSRGNNKRQSLSGIQERNIHLVETEGLIGDAIHFSLTVWE